MSVHQIGSKNGQWKGGKTIASNGYVLIRVGKEHHLADTRGYAYEHRLLAERKLDRKLLPGEQVHHINGNITDNSHENLEVVASIAAHREADGKRNPLRRIQGQENPEIKCECGCGSVFQKFDKGNRPRRFVNGHNVGVARG